jgi:hypothetical protein
MNLKEARIIFTSLLPKLLIHMADSKVQPAVAEVMDRLTKKDPTSDHMKGSLHELGLAADIDLYNMEGTYMSDTSDHLKFGQYWESLHPHCRWGGHFADGNHYSFAPSELVGSRA